MTQATISKRINKAAEEIDSLINKSKRKLLELEVMMGFLEIRQGKCEVFKTTRELFKKLK